VTGRHRVTSRRALDLAAILAAIAAAANNPLEGCAARVNDRANHHNYKPILRGTTYGKRRASASAATSAERCPT
jgi:hypothetical protein